LFNNEPDIDWYRSPIDREQLKYLMVRSDFKGWIQTLSHLGYYLSTGLLAYYVFTFVSLSSWHWSLPLLLLALFAHGTMGPFIGLVGVHELQHRTVFKTRWLNSFFERVYAFLSWSDYIWYEKSHPMHHLATCHVAHDGEVVLPVKFSLKNWKVWLGLLAWNPAVTLTRFRLVWRHAQGNVQGEWYQHVLPESNLALRRKHRNWARLLIVGHASLAITFIVTGQWFLIIVFTIGTFYCSWLGFLTGVAQHYGLNPNVPDFRLSTRTFTCSPIVGFFYWNMQYHLEHHMYPAVPFYNLAKLRLALIHDLPPATHGLLATWKEMLSIKEAKTRDPGYEFLPEVPAPLGK
jgi:fatty acid desaturase